MLHSGYDTWKVSELIAFKQDLDQQSAAVRDTLYKHMHLVFLPKYSSLLAIMRVTNTKLNIIMVMVYQIEKLLELPAENL